MIHSSPVTLEKFTLGAALAVLLCLCAPAPARADDSRPASTNVIGAQYPRVYPDGRATFRLEAPGAQKISVHVGGSTYDMAKAEDGSWTATSAPLVPGFHYYSFTLDGLSINDPGSETFFGVGREYSGIEIPEPGVDFYLPHEVPHGEIRDHWYHSSITDSWRRCFIYTPPGYDSSLNTRYPVLYLQHGGGEDERGWVVQGRVNFILDNLIASHKAKPMIIVMDRGYANRPGELVRPTYPPPPAALSAVTGAKGGATDARGARPGLDFSTFEDVMLSELIPHIDGAYRTIPDRSHRAIAGLSMGGMQAFRICLNHLDKFAYLGGFSGAGGGMTAGPFDLKTLYNGALSDAESFNRRMKLVWLGIGTVEPERMYQSVNNFHKALESGGIKHVYWESPGTAHEWQTWRRDLHEFAPLLFE